MTFSGVREDSSDDRIRELCSEAIAGTDRAKLDVVLSELRAAVHERIEELTVKKEGLCNPRCQY